jgi:hypothetical protein
MYYSRTNCILCNNLLNNVLFEKDLSIPIACYCKSDNNEDVFIPYNIYTCSSCKTSQTKYLGDLNIIYKYNHADSTGNIMENLHKKVNTFLCKYIRNITNITEIGSSKGILSSIILNTYNSIEKYYIVEPSFIGKRKTNRLLYQNFLKMLNTMFMKIQILL